MVFLRVKLAILLSFIGFLSYGQGINYTLAGSNVYFPDFSGLNRQIKGIYPELDNILQEYTLGYKMISSKLNIGLYGTYSFSPGEQSGQKQTKFTGVGLGLKYEYNIISKTSFLLHPHLTLGLRKYNLILGETSHGVSIEDVLNYEINNYKFDNFGEYIELGLGAEKAISLHPSKLWVEFSLGYRFDWGDWRYEGINPVYHELARLSGIVVAVRFSIPNKAIDKHK